MHSIIKNMCLVLCWIFSTSSLTGQTLSIIILDEKTNAPLPMVLVIDSVASQVFETNHEGILLLQQTYPSQKLKIQYLGYNTRYILIEEIKHFNGIILLQPNALSMEEVVISASRWNQSSARAPYRIQTLNQKNLWMRQPQNAADFLGAGGRVFIQKSQQGGGSPMIRGFATNRLLYSVDGVRMNTAIFRSGNIQNVINLDGFALEKAEILFGPGAVMYGSDAIGGVMAFQTLQPVLSSEAGKK
ncbi:MAG: TonB-dependent receptor plug domain-containing protein, partial [Saprospiraceae bacterium]|nr:TonB-dependent receptor plug domain-containing protein [Saprospiraceae bacterium]